MGKEKAVSNSNPNDVFERIKLTGQAFVAEYFLPQKESAEKTKQWVTE